MSEGDRTTDSGSLGRTRWAAFDRTGTESLPAPLNPVFSVAISGRV